MEGIQAIAVHQQTRVPALITRAPRGWIVPPVVCGHAAAVVSDEKR